jgi:hypothetical protein
MLSKSIFHVFATNPLLVEAVKLRGSFEDNSKHQSAVSLYVLLRAAQQGLLWMQGLKTGG